MKATILCHRDTLGVCSVLLDDHYTINTHFTVHSSGFLIQAGTFDSIDLKFPESQSDPVGSLDWTLQISNFHDRRRLQVTGLPTVVCGCMMQ